MAFGQPENSLKIADQAVQAGFMRRTWTGLRARLGPHLPPQAHLQEAALGLREGDAAMWAAARSMCAAAKH
jgi:hypothetical protein